MCWFVFSFPPRQNSTLQTLLFSGYTIYSTTGAFYVPLVVMCILYFRVFKATKNRRKAWIPIPLSASALMKANNTKGHDGGATTEMLVLVGFKKYISLAKLVLSYIRNDRSEKNSIFLNSKKKTNKQTPKQQIKQ